MFRCFACMLVSTLVAGSALGQSGRDLSGPGLSGPDAPATAPAPLTGYAATALASTAGIGERIAPGRLVVVYRPGANSASAESAALRFGARLVNHLSRLNVSALAVSSSTEAAVTASLTSRPEVAAVLHDRFVSAHALTLQQRIQPNSLRRPFASPDAAPTTSPDSSQPDSFYNSPQGWAVRQAGGFGHGVPGGSASGPWDRTLGAGVRLAILDSGVDELHPDIAPNLGLNLSEIDTSALPSPCDDGSPQDQQGHGTWVASLAAGALGGGDVVGVAPHATLLNIKVVERLPAATGATPAAQCESGEAGGLLSWVLQGIEDAIVHKADVITLSLGTLVDTTTGDGAGWKAAFDQVTYAATQAGTVIVGAVGNDGLDLSTGPYIELPAQARGVLAVVASTNPDCAENLATGAVCTPGPVTRPYYSNYGATLNALAAPGGSYPEGPGAGVSGWVRGACSEGVPNTADGLPAEGQSFGCFGLGHTAYVQAMGTSAAAPLVAGAAALLHAARPEWTATQVVQALRSSATISPAMAEPQLNLPAALVEP